MRWGEFIRSFYKTKRKVQTAEVHRSDYERLLRENKKLIEQVEILKEKERSFERIKKVFLEAGDRLMSAATSKEGRYALITLDPERQEIKVWGEYTAETRKFAHDCVLEYKYKREDGKSKLQVYNIYSTTRNQGYAALALAAVYKIAKLNDIDIISGTLPVGRDNSNRIKLLERMGFDMVLNEDQNSGCYYKERK